MISETQAKRFCKEDISKIENYDNAVSDNTCTWDCHHRWEKFWWWDCPREDLIKQGMYYNQPADRLIFLKHGEHIKLHHTGKHLSEDQKRRLSAIRKGSHHSEETKSKMSKVRRGKPKSESWKRKMSEMYKGIPQPNLRGWLWWNNGEVCVKAKECPKGFVRGRLKKRK